MQKTCQPIAWWMGFIVDGFHVFDSNRKTSRKLMENFDNLLNSLVACVGFNDENISVHFKFIAMKLWFNQIK